MSLATKVRERIAALVDEADSLKNILAQRELTEEEKTRLDAILAQLGTPAEGDQQATGLFAELEKAEQYDQRLQRAQQAATTNRISAQLRSNTLAPITPANDDLPVRVVGTVHHFPRTPEGRKDAYLFGRFVAAALFNHEDSQRFLRNYYPQLYGALGTGTGAAGGFLVPEQFEQRILDLIQQWGVARQFAMVVPMIRDDMVIPVTANKIAVAVTAENAAITESDPSFAQLNVVAKKWATLTRFSTELEEDAFLSIGDTLAGQIAEAFAKAEDSLVFVADGTAAYGNQTGVLQSVGAGGLVTAGSGETSWSTVTMDTFRKMLATLPGYAGARPRWYIHRYGYYEAMLRLMIAAQGNTVLTLAGGDGGLPQFLGYDVVFTDVLPGANAATGDRVALFGDLSQVAVLGDRRGVTIALDRSRYFELDQVAVRATRRMGVGVHHAGTATEAGAIVALKLASA